MELIIEYPIGEVIYLVSDPDQYERIVRRLIIDYTGIQYEVACGDIITLHYAFEITTTRALKDILGS